MITDGGGLGGRMEAAQPCKGANRSEAPVQKCKGERQRYGWRVAASGGRWRETFSGLRSRQSGIRYGLSGSGTGAGPEPVPDAEHLNPGPDGRDPGPENEIPVSGFPLRGGIVSGGARVGGITPLRAFGLNSEGVQCYEMACDGYSVFWQLA